MKIPVDKMRHDDALLLLLGSKAIPHENSPESENVRFVCARMIVIELDYLHLWSIWHAPMFVTLEHL